MRHGRLLSTHLRRGGRISRTSIVKVIAGRVRLAQQRIALSLFIFHQSQRPASRIDDLTLSECCARHDEQ